MKRKVLTPTTTSTGECPDYPGVVTIIDIDEPGETIIVVEDPAAALAWGMQIVQAAQAQLEPQIRVDGKIIVQRECPAALDS